MACWVRRSGYRPFSFHDAGTLVGMANPGLAMAEVWTTWMAEHISWWPPWSPTFGFAVVIRQLT